MAIRRILRYPDPFLRKTTKPIDVARDFLGPNEECSTIVFCWSKVWTDMEETLLKVDHGAALSAPQVGIGDRFFVTNQDLTVRVHDPIVRSIPPVVINPYIVDRSQATAVEEEGCLSFPGVHLNVRRHVTVRVKYETILHWNNPNRVWEHRSIEETYTDFWARMFQHEIDHLEGKLFFDFLSTTKKLQIAKRISKEA